MRNSKGKFRLFGWINPVDVLILVGVVALVWGAAVFSAPQKVSAKTGDAILRYTVELGEKEEGFHQKIETGAKLYDSVKGYEIGTIVEVYAMPYLEDAGDEASNIIRRVPVDGLEFVYVVVESPVQPADNAMYIGQYDVMVNKEVFVKSKKFAGKGYITAMELR